MAGDAVEWINFEFTGKGGLRFPSFDCCPRRDLINELTAPHLDALTLRNDQFGSLCRRFWYFKDENLATLQPQSLLSCWFIFKNYFIIIIIIIIYFLLLFIIYYLLLIIYFLLFKLFIIIIIYFLKLFIKIIETFIQTNDEWPK